jgi:translation initiation factor RLI1
VIKRFILHQKKTAFIVEHDFIMAVYLADKVLVFEGKPSVDCTASAPESLASGMNRFLSVSSIYTSSSLSWTTDTILFWRMKLSSN